MVVATCADGRLGQVSWAGLGLLEEDDVLVSAEAGNAADVADRHVEEVAVGGGWHDGLLRTTR